MPFWQEHLVSRAEDRLKYQAFAFVYIIVNNRIDKTNIYSRRIANVVVCFVLYIKSSSHWILLVCFFLSFLLYSHALASCGFEWNEIIRERKSATSEVSHVSSTNAKCKLVKDSEVSLFCMLKNAKKRDIDVKRFP